MNSKKTAACLFLYIYVSVSDSRSVSQELVVVVHKNTHKKLIHDPAQRRPKLIRARNTEKNKH